MLVIADTSPLRYLVVIGEERMLPAIFGEIWIPGPVLAELSRDAAPDPLRRLVEYLPAWLRSRDPQANVVSAISAELDARERAALALALELDADLVLVDDAAGRREANRLGIRITGAIASCV